MKLIKKTVALLLAAVMSLNLLAIPGFAEQRFNYYVTSFQELEDDLAIQYIADENQFSDLILPDTILAEGYIVSESEESPTIESKKEVQEITFFDVSWELVDTNKQGSGRTRNFIENKYIFAPVITGSCIVAEGVELPKVTAVVKPMINMMALMQPFGVGPFTVPNTASELANHLLSENSDITIVGTPKSTSNLAASSMYDFLNLGTMNVGGKDVEFSLPRGILVTSGSGTPPEKNSPAIYSVTSYGPKDQDVEDLAGVENSQDSFSLQFDFTVPENIPAVKFAFMFGSEEYPDYVDDVVDGAAVIVDGVNYAKFENGTPLKVVTEAALEPNNGLKIEYNGISAPRVINALLDKNRTTHTIKIVIADTSDTIYDSGLFISAMKTSTSEIGGIFESDDASLLSVAGITDNSPGSQSGKEPENAISWNIVVPAGKSSVNAGDIAVAAQATHELYSDSQFTQKLASGESISLIQGDTVPVYIKIRAKNGVTIRYYKVNVTRIGEIDSNDVIVIPYSGKYDGNSHSISVTDTKGGSITYSTSEAGVYTNENPGYRDVGNYTVYYKVDRGENYDILKDSSTVEITKAGINSSDVIAAPYSGVYDGKEHSISVADTKGGSITYSTSETGEYTSVNPLYRNVGSYTVYYKVDRGENYDILKGSSKVEITEADINLSDVIATAYSGAYDGNNHSISVTDTRGGSITYSTSETGVYTNENPGYRAVGSYTVYYKVDRGTNYNVLKGLSNVEITKADINSSDVIATPYRGTYDGKEHSISATDTKGGIITYSTSETGVYTNENPGYRDVGSYTVYYKVDRGENYNVLKGSSTVEITKADINSSDVIATAYSGVYDGKEHSISVEDAKGGSITYSTSESEVYTSVKPMYENVGSYTVYYKVDRGTNYNILTDSSIVEITEADMDSSDVTVIPYSGVYDGDNHSISVTDTKGGSITYSIGEAEEYSNEKPEYQDVGSYTVYYKVDRGANYNVLKSSSTVEITKADINSSDVNVTKYSGTYDGNNHSISVTDAKGGSITYSTDESEEHTSKNPEYKNAGSYTVYYKIDRGTNYNILKDSSTVNINLRDVSIKGITVTDKIYDGTADASSHITGAYLDGVLDEDEITLDSSGMTAMFDDGEIGTDKSVTVLGYAIKGLNISQYNLIQPKNITGNILSETSNHVGVLIERVTAREKEYIGGWINHDVTIIVSGSAPSGVEKYQYTTDGGLIWTDFTDSELLINETTDKSYAFRSISRGGITSDSSNGVEIKVDKIKPVIKDVQGNPTALKNTPQVITFDILEENSGIDLNTLTVSKNGVHIEIKNENGIYSFVAEENGSYEVNVSDYAGNSSDTATVLVNKLDFEKPIISSLTPANKDEEVYTDSLIVTFNEEVMKSASNISGDIIISNSRGQIFDKIDIHNNRVKILGKQLSIYLKRPLEPSTEYYVTIDGGIIYDKAGNSFTGIKDAGTWRFKTNKANITNSIIGIDISVMGEQYSAIVDPNDETIYSAVAKPGINGEIIVKIIPVFLANAELVISSSEEGVSVKGDTVTIYDVNKESANIVLKIKNSDGSFDEKTYTLIIHRGSLETKITKTGINADIDAGNLKGVVDVSSEISNGNNMELELTIVDNEKSLNEAQKLEIANFLNDQEIALYFDVELKLKNFTESYETSISNTQNPVRIKIEIPENMRNGKDYKVIRLHNGVMEILDTVVEGSYLIFETDRFSQYAISYTPVKEKDTKDTNAQGSVLHEHKAYMKGYEDLTYRPENFITRAETATIIARLSTNYDEQKYYINSYNDVDSAAWYANTVGFGTQSKIIKGYEDGSFRPNHSITRAELVSIIARLNNVETEDKSEQHFNDVSGHWAEKYIMALYGLGWIKGYEDGSFRPDASITRAEAVKIINASFGRTPSKEKVDRNISKYKLSFTDVEAGHWAYYEILESAITHIVIDFN